MMQTMNYRKDLDALKGMAILFVVLYHVGIIKYGYLGVDVFLVINGYLIIPRVLSDFYSGEFRFGLFLKKRILRLLPLISVASAVSLLIGFIFMLPDDYENLAQSVVASNLMSENILSSVTTKDYWNVANEYKPLMHLWYVGIIFQFYLLFPILMYFASYVSKILKNRFSRKQVINVCFISAVVVSFMLYLYPGNIFGNKFYNVAYRFFELGIGGVAWMLTSKANEVFKKANFAKTLNEILLLLLFLIILFSFIIQSEDFPNVIGSNVSVPVNSHIKTILLLSTVVITAFIIVINKSVSILSSNVFIWLGKMSFSIFVWHQVLLAFYRYIVTDKMAGIVFLVYLVVTFLISFITYKAIEQKIRTTNMSMIISGTFAIFLVVISVGIYLRAGVVRNVPELNVSTKTAYRGMFAEYCDRIYELDTDFHYADRKSHVLIVGNSYARDFANVLLESKFKDSIVISYSYDWDYEKLKKRIEDSDYIFSFSAKTDVPEYVWQCKKLTSKVYGIGTKNYGTCNGQIYAKRFSKNYYSMTALLRAGYADLNTEWKNQWGKDYIDFLSPVALPNGRVEVFTPDRKYISQDCSHLTRSGAIYYSQILQLENIFTF